MTPVAPRIVNDVSYVTRRIKQASHFAWQVQHLVKFKCHFSRQVQHLVMQVQVSLFVAGAAFGEVQV